MSGYLQRLVNAAAGGGDAVHPRTGSIFSPRGEETPAPGHGSQDHEHDAVPPPYAQLRAASPHAEPAQPANVVARGSTPTPLFPTASEATAAQSIEPAPSLVRAASPHDLETVVHADERAREPRRVGSDRPSDVRGVAPIARDAAEASPVWVTPDRVPEPRPRSAGPTRLRAERHVDQRGQRERQPDDIQIHIGRIEVIALPPPAPRAAKAPDRSVSLEAYLNRRDGRPR